jgi:hypothetical protein
MHERPTSVSPSIDPARVSAFRRRGWSASQVRESLDMLDETGLRLLSIYGDPRCAAYVGGEWVIVIAGLTVRAQELRRVYAERPSIALGDGCPALGIVTDGLLLAATRGPLTPDRIEAMAAKLAPATWDGIDSPADARERIAQQVNVLLDRGLLAESFAHGGGFAWVLTAKGTTLASRKIRARWRAASVR